MRFSKPLYIILILLAALKAQALGTVQTTFQASYESYLSSGEAAFGSDTTESQMARTGFAIDYMNRSNRFETHLDLEGFYNFAEEEPYINPREFFVTRESSKRLTSVGIKKETWSSTDEFWEMGLWQPRFLYDKLRPEQVGLTGFFRSNKKIESTRWTFFASPVYVPEQAPHYYKENGLLKSKNPWFSTPPTTALLGLITTPLRYTVDKPDTEDVVLSPSLAFRVETDLGEEAKNQVGFAYGYKPINQMVISYDYRLRLNDVGQTAPVRVVPDFPYHHIVTTDWTTRGTRWRSTGSVTFEHPENVDPDPQLISQQLGDQTVVAWMISYDILGEGVSAFKGYGGVIRSWGGVKPDSGDTLTPGTQFEIRTRWNEAYRIGLDYPIWKKVRRLHNKIEFTYDRLQNGSALTSQLEYGGRDWVITTGVDILAVYDSRDTKYDKSLTRAFRANDRLNVGVSYAY